jgi:hypothetical protein
MKTYGGGYVEPGILTLLLVGGERSTSRPDLFTYSTLLIQSWVGPRAGLDDVVKKKILPLQGLELRYLGRPARSQSLHQLRYPGSICI